MKYTRTLPTEPGMYKLLCEFGGYLYEETVFVGYTNGSAPKLQGSEPDPNGKPILRVCEVDDYLYSDRLTPSQCGGWWAKLEDTKQEDLK